MSLATIASDLNRELVDALNAELEKGAYALCRAQCFPAPGVRVRVERVERSPAGVLRANVRESDGTRWAVDFDRLSEWSAWEVRP